MQTQCAFLGRRSTRSVPPWFQFAFSRITRIAGAITALDLRCQLHKSAGTTSELQLRAARTAMGPTSPILLTPGLAPQTGKVVSVLI